MHGDIGLAGKHSLLQFLDEQSLATDLRKRTVQHAVTLGTHAHQFNLQPGIQLLQACPDMLRLPQCQRAFSCCDAKLLD